MNSANIKSQVEVVMLAAVLPAIILSVYKDASNITSIMIIFLSHSEYMIFATAYIESQNMKLGVRKTIASR